MKLDPAQASAGLAYYAWKCAQLETMLSDAQRALDASQKLFEKLQARDVPAGVGPAPVDGEGNVPD
jgi:hypothetical protein